MCRYILIVSSLTQMIININNMPYSTFMKDENNRLQLLYSRLAIIYTDYYSVNHNNLYSLNEEESFISHNLL